MGANRPGNGAHVATASFMVGERRPRPRRRPGARRGRHRLGHARAASAPIQFNAVVETNTAAVTLWRSLGFEVVGTVPEAFEHPAHGYVGLHVMLKRL